MSETEQYDTAEFTPAKRPSLLRQWFVKHHGEGAENQYDCYRCDQCRGLITHRIIARGGCGCAASKLRPTNPTAWETIKLLVLPWLMK